MRFWLVLWVVVVFGVFEADPAALLHNCFNPAVDGAFVDLEVLCQVLHVARLLKQPRDEFVIMVRGLFGNRFLHVIHHCVVCFEIQ